MLNPQGRSTDSGEIAGPPVVTAFTSTARRVGSHARPAPLAGPSDGAPSAEKQNEDSQSASSPGDQSEEEGGDGGEGLTADNAEVRPIGGRTGRLEAGQTVTSIWTLPMLRQKRLVKPSPPRSPAAAPRAASAPRRALRRRARPCCRRGTRNATARAVPQARARRPPH